MLKVNVLANFLGGLWPSILGFFLTPVYINLLGVDAYGFTGFFISLQGLLVFLDIGLSTTANREFARHNTDLELAINPRDLLRTLEVVYGIVAFFVIIFFFVASNWLASEWLTSSKIDVDTLRFAIIIFGVTLGLRWPSSLYIGVLRGREKQVLQNIIMAISATIRIVGAVLVIMFISRTLIAFLFWQLFSAIIETLFLIIFAWRLLPPINNDRAKFKFQLLQSVWKFSASIGFTSLLANLFKQFDRLAISRLMTLEWLGYYSVANTLYQNLSMIVLPVTNAAFPRFSSLVAKNDLKSLKTIYHQLTQLISFLVCPISSLVIFFSYDILLLWTHSIVVAQNAYITLSILATAYMFNSMMHLPYRLQLAFGVTYIALGVNIGSAIVFTPLTYLLVKYYGINGAGISWVVFNLLCYLIIPQVMHNQILPSEKKQWIFYDTLPFMIISLILYAGAAWLYWHLGGYWTLIFSLLVASFLYIILCLWMYAFIRSQLFEYVLKLKIQKIFSVY